LGSSSNLHSYSECLKLFKYNIINKNIVHAFAQFRESDEYSSRDITDVGEKIIMASFGIFSWKINKIYLILEDTFITLLSCANRREGEINFVIL
jgi:hypothetical protein